MNVAVCEYGAGNVRSVAVAFERLGARARITSSPAEVEAARDDQVAAVGTEWATRQCRELLDAGVPYLHFYVMQSTEHASQVIRALRKAA